MIGHWGSSAVAEALAPWTGDAPTTQAGQGFQAVVNAIPGIQAQIHQIMNPGTLQALVKREARLVGQLAAEQRPDRRLILQAELKLVQEQLAQLRGALAPSAQPNTQIQAVSTSSTSWVWGLGGVAAAITIGLIMMFGNRRGRR